MKASLVETVDLGRRVDPIIFKHLRESSSSEFRSTVSYHFQAGGKRVRSAMTILSCLACGGSVEDGVWPAAVVEMIHNYSLVMDDIIDRAVVRRGHPTLRVQAGESVALLVAMQYREVLEVLIDGCKQAARVRNVAVGTMKQIIDGERLDLLLEQAGRRDNYLVAQRIVKPSFKLYLNMIGKKTASLFEAAAKLGAIVAGASTRTESILASYGWNAGLAFQIIDDALDIFGSGTGKQRAKDIIEHKMGNAAVLMAMRFLTRRDRSELQNVLKLARVDRNAAERAIRLIEKTPAERASREAAQAYLAAAQEQLSGLTPSKHVNGLGQLAEVLARRSF